jgi:hypothetical protein
MKEALAVVFLVFWFGVILFAANRARERREAIPDRDRPLHLAFGVIPLRPGRRRTTPHHLRRGVAVRVIPLRPASIAREGSAVALCFGKARVHSCRSALPTPLVMLSATGASATAGWPRLGSPGLQPRIAKRKGDCERSEQQRAHRASRASKDRCFVLPR